MIHHARQVVIQSPPENVYQLIETMPNKFPITGFLESRLFLFFRLLFINGFQEATKLLLFKKLPVTQRLLVGDRFGPFVLIEANPPIRYWFELKSRFFDCRTGYTLSEKEGHTLLCFELITENPTVKERIWWLFVRPIHTVLAKKVLSVIKDRTEQPGGFK